ncbi:phage Gp37/Gp68 family protein [Phaeobacter sp. JH20_02]|uniref:DUF5131 family protein n=1 Tax=unclassified Phaeobacter TaxID=2621772 RepID=UPI003A8BCF50
MAENSGIEWTTHTFNPWTGCTAVSAACDHCYAEGWAKRSGHVQWGPHGERRRTKTWGAPLKWDCIAGETGTRVRVFCASLADVFDNHRSIKPEWRQELWELIRITPNIDWLLLTKRPQNIKKMLPAGWGDGWPNVWLGTTVENQVEAERRIPALLNIPAKVRFLSCEPMLGPVQLDRICQSDAKDRAAYERGEVESIPGHYINALEGIAWDDENGTLNGEVFDCDLNDGPRVNWVICGGESGPGSRPMHRDWARSLRDQCARAGTGFHFKQWGDWLPGPGFACPDDLPKDGWHHFDPDCSAKRVGKKKAGRSLDGREWNGSPQFNNSDN